MRVLICGSREWVNHEAIAAEVQRLHKRYGRALVIIHGDARGADRVRLRNHSALRLRNIPPIGSITAWQPGYYGISEC